jgi:mxaD protein
MGHIGHRLFFFAALAGLVVIAGCAPPPAISMRIVAVYDAVNLFDRKPGKLTVTEIRTAATTPNRVWAVVGDFRGIGSWHPWAAQPARYPQGDPRAEGATRVLPLVSGGSMRDRLLEWDGTRMTLRYAAEDGDLSVTKFEATMRVTNNLNGTSNISWSAIFDAAEGTSEEQAIAEVQEFFAAGLDALTALSL